ncbi:uncharacterized protein LOC135848380 isoform X2 [Planococcus citri]|uniref:uncharacterized protein LOC135848380 isoform X2 n=1 Tax=Planococcus citri TaxID=170843 RepID=UPI0031F76605
MRESIIDKLESYLEILQLRAEPDFRAVKLYWEYPKHGGNFYGFQIHYCELQAWGPNRCRTKEVDKTSGLESLVSKKFQMYSVIIGSLRMATNYSFEVRPLESRHESQNAKEYGKTLIVPTKGFSAKASLCLPDVSEVEVSTGPYFGGRIAVESSNGAKSESCSVGGDASSARDTYTLRIEHKYCGSMVNRTTVSTFILVQETLPILTHSTRRFLVLCTFQPETLTVRAGINLPHTGLGNHMGATSAMPVKNDYTFTNEILGNDVQAASLMQVNDAGHHSRSFKEHSDPHYLLISALFLTSIIGIALTIWWMVPLKRSISFRSRKSNLSIFSSDSSAYENYSNSMRDNVSITDIDFGNILEENNYAVSEGCRNEVFNPALSTLSNETNSSSSQITVSIEEQSQSEA